MFAEFKDMYCKDLQELMFPTYPRWEKRWSGTHWESCDCGCPCCEHPGDEVPDKDAVLYDVYVMEAPKLFDMLPKRKMHDTNWRIKE